MRKERRQPEEQDERFYVKKQARLFATIGRQTGGDLDSVEAEPIDVSESGMKLRVGVPFQFEESITLIVGADEGQLCLAHQGRVTWLRQESEHSWLLGCKFVPKLPAEALEKMFSLGAIERRRFRRYPVSGQGTAQWELQADPFNIWLVDISEGGLCICCAEPGPIGQRVRLNIESPRRLTLQAKVQWCAALDSAFLVGCTFMDHNSFVRLREALAAPAEA